MAITREEFQGMKMRAIKPSEMVRKEAKLLGFTVDDEEFTKQGSDWIWLRRMYPKDGSMPLQVKYNTTNGAFFAMTPFSGDRAYTEGDYELEGTDWYAKLLLMLYAPDIKVGDRVAVKAQGITVRGEAAVVHWWDGLGWDIEIDKANVMGGYSRWKQWEDGGTLISWSGLPASEDR